MLVFGYWLNLLCPWQQVTYFAVVTLEQLYSNSVNLLMKTP